MDHRRVNPAIQTLWLSFSRMPGLNRRTGAALLDHFRSIEAVFAADRAAIEDALRAIANEEGDPRGTQIWRALSRGPEEEATAADVAWLQDPTHHLITWCDTDYPPFLRQIADPPVVFYAIGDRSVLMRPQFAIVGSRNPTPLGAQNAKAFAAALTGSGLTITSGMALGIDAAAHRGALEAGGSTVAVAGTGLDRVYPAAHRDLAHAIAGRGALISEFPVGTTVRAGNFPVRNRLISGMSLGVLVVEAALRSGSLITARLAGEQGREVFALPGSIHSPLARGCHALIRQGAKLVETAEHILEELRPLVELISQPPVASPRGVSESLQAFERQLLDCLGYEPTHIDVLIERSGLTADTVSSILLQMELRGLVLAGPGGYQRAPDIGER